MNPRGTRRVGTRDAATLVIVDRTRGAPRILMGRRRSDQVFLPNKYVFPGGRVERADHRLTCAGALQPRECDNLRLALNGRRAGTFPQALALAAIRETFEETGLIIGRRAREHGLRGPQPWQAFLTAGFTPNLAPICFFARAITPPGRPRRYDTRFFIVPATEIAHSLHRTDGELSSLDWFTLKEMETLDLPGITRLILADLRLLLESPATDTGLPIPFYIHRNGIYAREILSSADPPT